MLTLLGSMMTVQAAEPVAVVELFTSQGCSSCPAADAVIGRIAAEAREDGHPVYVLSFHVDYWDKLGWKDPYGDERWTGRQRMYSAALGEAGKVYTPQVVVNGTEHVVGSQEPLVKGLIAGALLKQTDATVSGEAVFTDGAVTVEVTTDGAPKSAQLFVAVVEKERRNPVPRGENKGRELVSTNVVRAMVKADAAGAKGKMPLPDDFLREGAEVFAWVQHGLTNEVIGAAKLTVE